MPADEYRIREDLCSAFAFAVHFSFRGSIAITVVKCFGRVSVSMLPALSRYRSLQLPLATPWSSLVQPWYKQALREAWPAFWEVGATEAGCRDRFGATLQTLNGLSQTPQNQEACEQPS